MDVSRVFQRYIKDVLRVFIRRFKKISIFHACFKEVSGVSQEHLKGVSKSFKGVSRVFYG